MVGTKILPKSRRDRQSSIASRYLAAIESAQNNNKNNHAELTLSPVSRRSKSSHTKSTETSKTVATAPTLDQTSGSSSWTEASLSQGGNILSISVSQDLTTPGSVQQALEEGEKNTATVPTDSKKAMTFSLFPSDESEGVVVTAAELGCSDGSSLTSRRTSDTANTDPKRKPRDDLDASLSSVEESREQERQQQHQQTRANSSKGQQSRPQHLASLRQALGHSIDDGLKFLFQTKAWTVFADDTCEEMKSEVMRKGNPIARTVSEARSDFTGASTQIATNRAADVQQRIRMLQEAMDEEPASKTRSGSSSKKAFRPIKKTQQIKLSPRGIRHPPRYSFGDNRLNPTTMESRSILSFSSNDESSRSLNNNTKKPSTQEEDLHSQRLPFGKPSSAGRLGNFVNRLSSAREKPSREASPQSRSLSSSVRVEIDGKNTDQDAPPTLRHMLQTKKTLSAPSRNATMLQNDVEDADEHDKSQTVRPLRGRGKHAKELLLPSLNSSERVSENKTPERKLVETRKFVNASAGRGRRRRRRLLSEASFATPPKIQRHTVGKTVTSSPDPIFCPQQSSNSSSIMSPASENATGSTVSGQELNSSQSSSEMTDHAVMSFESPSFWDLQLDRKTLDNDAMKKGQLSTPMASRLAQASSRPSLEHRDGFESPDSIFCFGSSPSSSTHQSESDIITEAASGKEDHNLASSAKQDKHNAQIKVPMCIDRSGCARPTSIDDKRPPEPRLLSPPAPLRKMTLSAHQLREEGENVLHSDPCARKAPKPASAFLAAISKFDGQKTTAQKAAAQAGKMVTCNEKLAEKQKTRKKSSEASCMTFGVLEAHLSRNSASTKNRTEADQISVDVESIRSAFESNQASAGACDDDDDSNSVKSLRERYETPTKHMAEDSTVHRICAIFEPKKRPSASRGVESSNGAMKEALSKFDAQPARPRRRSRSKTPAAEMPSKRESKVSEQKEMNALSRLESVKQPLTSVADRIRAFGGSQQQVFHKPALRNTSSTSKQTSSSDGVSEAPPDMIKDVRPKHFPPSSFEDNMRLFSGEKKEEEAAKLVASSVFREKFNKFSVPTRRPRSIGPGVVKGSVVPTSPLPQKTSMSRNDGDIISKRDVASPKPVAIKTMAVQPALLDIPVVKPLPIKPVVKSKPIKSGATPITPTQRIAPKSSIHDRILMFSGNKTRTKATDVSVAASSVTRRLGIVPLDSLGKSKTLENKSSVMEGRKPSRTAADHQLTMTDAELSDSQKTPSPSSTPSNNGDHPESSESEFSDGVTLDLSIADVSNLTNPTALLSKTGCCDRSEITEEGQSSNPSSKSVDLIEVEAKHSEASSSHTSDAALPLINKALRTLPMSDELSANSFFAKRGLIAKQWSRTSGWENGAQAVDPFSADAAEMNIAAKNSEDLMADNSSEDNSTGSSGWDLGRVESSFPVTKSSLACNIFDLGSSDWDSFPSSSPVLAVEKKGSSDTRVFDDRSPESGRPSPRAKTPTSSNASQLFHSRQSTKSPFFTEAVPLTRTASLPARQSIASNQTSIIAQSIPSRGDSAWKRRPGLNYANEEESNTHPVVYTQSAEKHRSSEQSLDSSSVKSSDSSIDRLEARLLLTHRRKPSSTISDSSIERLKARRLSTQWNKPLSHVSSLSADQVESHLLSRSSSGKGRQPSWGTGSSSSRTSKVLRTPVTNKPTTTFQEYSEKREALMARLRLVKEARMRHALYGTYDQSSTASAYSQSSTSHNIRDDDEYASSSSSTRSSTQFGGSTFMASLDVD